MNNKPIREVSNGTRQYTSFYALFREDQKSKTMLSLTEELFESKETISQNNAGFNDLGCRLAVEYGDEIVVYNITKGDYNTFRPHIESCQRKMNCLSLANKRKVFFVDGLMCVSFGLLSVDEIRKLMLECVVRCVKNDRGVYVCVCENRKTFYDYQTWGYYCNEKGATIFRSSIIN